MKRLVKLYTALLAVVVTVASAGVSHAAFTSINKQAKNAIATISGVETITMALSVKDRLTNASGTDITWTGVAPGSGWQMAGQYIQLDTNITTSKGGVQIYTENKAVGASPLYTGLVSSYTATPAGLVNTVNTAKKIPTAWRIVADTTTANTQGAADPNGGGIGFSWLYHKDRAQVAVPSLAATAFVEAEKFITAYKGGLGIHYGQSDPEFGGFKVVDRNYIYTQADFTNALSSEQYQTNKLIVEAFSE